SEEAVKALIDNAVAIYGRLDAAFNNAGNSTDASPFQDQSTEKFQEMIQTNILGTFWCMKYELKHFLEKGAGSIVNMASIGGLHGIPFTGSYVATRHAVVGMTRTAAVETAARGVTVNAVAPGAILTNVMQASFDSGLWTEEKIASMFPVKKMGQPVDIARGVSFLLNSPYVTGTILEIEGGFRSRTIVI
ncbi:NAD(P)-binding protein, partial [Thozetella sp. PMI_491]